jgi:hypothetical protein
MVTDKESDTTVSVVLVGMGDTIASFGQVPAGKSVFDQQARTVKPSVGLERLPGT